MKVVTTFPPNYREVNAAFNVRGKPVIFCYGDRIYDPEHTGVGPDLVAHEQVHSVRQGHDPAAWWKHYIESPEFRLAEEIPAHQAEYQFWAQRTCAGAPVKGFRSELAFHHLWIAKRLASPLYGSLISLTEAKALVAA
jgi:hypothetical protein